MNSDVKNIMLLSYKKKSVWNREVYDTSQDVKAEKSIYFYSTYQSSESSYVN